MKRLRIGLCARRVSMHRGGAEKYVVTMARLVAEAGHDVWVFAAEADVEDLPEAAVFRRVFVPRLPGAGWLKAYWFAWRAERMIRSVPLDLVVGFDKTWHQDVYVAVGGAHPALLVSSSRRFRSVLPRLAWWGGKLCSPRQWVFWLIAQRQFRRRQPHVVAPSRMSAEHFQRYHRIPPHRLSVVYNAVDRDVSLGDRSQWRRTARAQWGLSDDQVVVLFAARNYALKGLEPLLAAFARVGRVARGARLMVCGSCRDGRYRRMAERMGIGQQVIWLPYVDDIRLCLAAADLFVLPTFYDPCSLVVLEAMCAGLPAITTRQNGASELIRPGVDGFVVPSPWATEQLAAALGELVLREGLRRRMGQQARAASRQFTLEARRQEMLDVLLAVADRRTGRRRSERRGRPDGRTTEAGRLTTGGSPVTIEF